MHHLNKVSSRSNFVNEYTPDRERTGTAINEFVAIDSVVAVAAPQAYRYSLGHNGNKQWNDYE